MKEKIKVIQYGLGPIGSAIARLVVEREGPELVGGVDIDSNKIGKDVGEVIGPKKAYLSPVKSINKLKPRGLPSLKMFFLPSVSIGDQV